MAYPPLNKALLSGGGVGAYVHILTGVVRFEEKAMSLLVFIVKAGQAYPPKFYQLIDYLKTESVSRSRKKCQNQIGIPAHEMSSEYFSRT